VGRRKGSRGAAIDNELAERAEWISERLAEYGDGVHRLGQPAVVLDSALPLSIDTVCREFDGAELFHESVVLFAGSRLQKEEGRYHVGEYAGDDIYVDEEGRVWRLEKDTGELLPEGTRFDRWLAGVIDAESVIYENDGEFRDGVFDEEGELSEESAAERERRQLGRDTKAIAPRWRLARILAAQGRLEKARDSLEEVVAAQPDFPWAWFDLARISEQLGHPDSACDEAEMAADARPDYEHAAFFLGHAARYAKLADLEERVQSLSQRVLEMEPDLPRRHREGARELMGQGDMDAARQLLEVAKVLAPRDLETLDLLRQLDS
jgi:tetratricopeptide (TPR) repeat protein